MKKILFVLILLLPTLAFSQEKLELTPSGLKVQGNPEAKYIIIEKSGSQQDLFNTIKSFISNYFVSPKDVISEVDNDMITLNGISAKDISVKKGLGYLDITMNYTIVFHFKDGRIRIDLPYINKMTSRSSSTLWQMTINQDDAYDYSYDHLYIFDKKGKLKNNTAKDGIENFFNSFIDKAVNFKSPQKEDW